MGHRFLIGVLVGLGAAATAAVIHYIRGRRNETNRLEGMRILIERLSKDYPDRIRRKPGGDHAGEVIPEEYYIFDAGRLGDEWNYLLVRFEMYTTAELESCGVVKVENGQEKFSESFSENDLRHLLMQHDILATIYQAGAVPNNKRN